MKNEYVIGIDIGTSGCKSIIVDNMGEVIASALEEYKLYTPNPGWAEQNPDDWWIAILKTVKQVVKKALIDPISIKGIGLSGQMHGLVALDNNFNIIRPAILWNDQRTYKQCQEIINAVGGQDKLLRYTNNGMLPGYTGGKILWLKEEEPENYQRVKIFLNPKDYIRYKLTGEIATEVSDASGTGLFDVKNRKWNEELLKILDISKELLPKCYESPEITGHLSDDVSFYTGLPKNLPVTGGGGDSVIQTTGTGLIKEGILGTTIGTAGIIAMGLNNFKFNSTGKLQIFCNNAPNKWHIMGVTLSAGGSFQWFKNTLSKYEIEQALINGIDVYKLLDEKVKAESQAGSKNLIFLPYLIGERCPYPDPNAKGVFFGLTLRHTFSDIARAVMEGVIYSFRQVYELIIDMDKSLAVKEIRVSGGGSVSKLWRQIHADIFQLPVKTVSGSKEGGAYGAALVAGVGCKIWNNLEEATQVLKIEAETEPDLKNKEIYEELYEIYKEMYPNLKGLFDKISKI
ncbi:MAG: xylulokinase [Actinobacteria bacterium]|nr:xylulokinase [Cyanobacteriota bacterium]MCL6087132.1 xylulokinase [Actinomycetota bacterium]